MGCSLRRPPVENWGGEHVREDRDTRPSWTLSLLNAVAGRQKELALFPAPKGRGRRNTGPLRSFFLPGVFGSSREPGPSVGTKETQRRDRR